MNTKLNKSDFYLLVTYFVVNLSFSANDYYTRGALVREYYVDFTVEVIAVCTMISLFLFWLIPKYILNSRKYVHFAVFALFWLLILGAIEYIIGYWSGANDWSKFPSMKVLFLKSIGNMSQNVGLPLGLLLVKKYHESQTQILDIQKQQKENELKLLRSQIDPHFLFNNLNTLDALIDSNPQKAKEYINRLSLIYRYLIKTKDAEVMELSEEIQLAENYIFLIKTRFGNDYDFTIEKNTTIINKFVPTGTIQTLLENVVKHNKPQNNIPIKTVITIGNNILKITNLKSGIKSKDESFGTGLKNLKTRYKLISDKKITILNTEKEFTIYIPIINLSEEN